MAQIPANYYNAATGLNGYELKSQLHAIISNGHSNQGYDALYEGYETTDSDNYYENDGSVLDMYSENPSGTDPYNYTHGSDHCGQYTGENDCYNREHIVPQSVFGSASPMVADIHFVTPTDGYVNNRRSNYAFGEVSSASWTSLNGSKVGSNTYGSYTGTVFEPIDEFKGDIARMLFYFATRYETQVDSWSHPMFNGTEDQVFADWFLDMILEWHANDPVSVREIDRNNAAYDFQGNANPFISHPEWVNIIWNPTPDTENPTAPTNLTANIITNSSVSLDWDAATDDVGVTHYEIYKNSLFLDTSTTTTYTATGLSGSTEYDFYVIAKDAAANSSTPSNTVAITTLVGPNYIINEDFNDCATVGLSFVSYNEASNKDWTCQVQYGFDNSGCYQVNGYQEDTPSKDWLITSNPIDFTVYADEKISFYLIDTYGSTPLELVYSVDYAGSGNPATSTWTAVPNVVINAPSGTSSETTQQITAIDISSISQSAYLAFKYYSNGSPTRWNVDNFFITTSNDTGFENEETASSCLIFPNPTTDNITVESKESMTRICFFNLLGQEILCVNPSRDRAQISLAHLEIGTYFMTVTFSDSSKTYKVIKQ